MTVMPLVLEFLHLRFKRGGRDLGAGIADLVHQTVITKNDHLGRLIDYRLGDLREAKPPWHGKRLQASAMEQRGWGFGEAFSLLLTH